MPKGDIHAQIDARVQEFVNDLTELIRESAFEAVREAIEGASSGAATPRRRAASAGRGGVRKATKKKAGRRRKKGGRRVRRSEEEIAALGSTFLDYVRANPGQRLEEIGAGLSMDTADLKRPVTNLIEAGKLRTEGQKRGTKYFAGRGGAAKAAPRRKASRKKVSRKKAASK